MHTLFLILPESNDCQTQKVLDGSIYSTVFPISNALLEVTPPGYDCAVVLNVYQNFNLLLNVTNLNIITSVNGTVVTNLPDGIYHYKYSVNPNVRSFIEYDKLRTCKLMGKYRQAIRKLFDRRSKYTFDIYNQKLNDLLYINHLITAAKYMVDDNNGDNSKAILLYDEATLLLKDSINCDVC